MPFFIVAKRTNVYFFLDKECMFVYYKTIEKNKRSERADRTMMRTTGRRKYRIKSRLRFTIFIVILLLMTVTAANAVLGFYNADGLTEQEYMQIQVESGDTLWSIADEYMPDDMDRRESVHIISSANDINASQLYPGQILDIPVQ